MHYLFQHLSSKVRNNMKHNSYIPGTVQINYLVELIRLGELYGFLPPKVSFVDVGGNSTKLQQFAIF